MTNKELKVHQKQEVEQEGEPTKPEKCYIPTVDIYENEISVTVLAEMPGVGKDEVEIDLDEGVLTIKGSTGWKNPEDRTVMLQEFEAGCYLRRFNVAETIDQEKISASISNGLLKVILPKLEPAKPKKIEVTVG